MYYLDDNDIDRLSQGAAGNYKAPGAPSWDALQQTLDKELPQEKEKKRRGFFLLFLLTGLFVTAGLCWYGYQKQQPSIIIPIRQEASASVKKDKENILPVTIPPENDNTNKKIPGPPSAITNNSGVPVTSNRHAEEQKDISVAATSIKIKNQAATANKRQNGNNNLPKQELNATKIDKTKDIAFVPSKKSKTPLQYSNHQTTFLAQRNKQGNKTGIYNNNTDTKEIVTKTALDGNDTQDNNKLTDKIDNAVLTPDSSNNNSIDKKTIAVTDSATVKPVADSVNKEVSTSSVNKKKTASKHEKAIMVGLTGGIDYSTVKFTHADKAGFNIGVLSGYQFSKHWSVYTGIIYTKKNYKLNGADYHPPKHYWTTYVDLQTVEGYCRMWEVPVQLRYTFNSKSVNKFFISTGLSSYFMKRQQYNYLYKTNTGTYGSSAWSNDSSFNHIFSILHFSAGFQKQFGKHLNWQVEPYAKIPLGGVGFGDIRLSSFGINFSIQYRQPVKH